MVKYIFKRILFFIPTLIAISLLTFFISINAPGDPVEIMLNRSNGSEGQNAKNSAGDKDYAALRNKLGFDLPVFYFSLTDATISDTLYRISNPSHRETLKRLSNDFGIWENVSEYYLSVQQLELRLFSIAKTDHNASRVSETKNLIDELYRNYEKSTIKNTLEKISNQISDTLENERNHLSDCFERMISEKNPYRKYIPVLHWFGFNNQYHHWVMNFITGDFGISYQDKRPVENSLYDALGKTLGISLTSILLAYCIAIPLGVHSSVKKGTRNEKTISTTLFILYSLPNFWIATMLVVFLCGGDYLSWFPAPGSPAIPDDAPLWYKFSEGVYRLLLPLFCWTYGSLAFISRQMRGGILASITQDYIQTARAKGLDEKQVIWKHAMKNSLLPLITLFASIFPLAISGSFVIETIFNIPGMGKLGLDALYARDYPIIFTVMMFTAILTMLGNLVSDILYALVDPRIAYTKKS
ncbi:MAG: ABC transporter permease [Bacteroidetes bacterium]|nr:ABC transporter permease [Bacteroidota bacterium]